LQTKRAKNKLARGQRKQMCQTLQIQRNYVAGYSKIPYRTIEKGQIHETRSLLLFRATIKILGMKLELCTAFFKGHRPIVDIINSR